MCDEEASSCVMCMSPSKLCTWNAATNKCEGSAFCSALQSEGKCARDYCETLLTAYDPVVGDGDVKIASVKINNDTDMYNSGGTFTPYTLDPATTFEASTINMSLELRQSRCESLFTAETCQELAAPDATTPAGWLSLTRLLAEEKNLSDCVQAETDNVYYCDYQIGDDHYVRLRLTTTTS